MAIVVVGIPEAFWAIYAQAGTSLLETAPAGTDTSNAFDGLDLGGFGICLIEPTLVDPPAALASAVEKAVPLPLPVLVKGRPT